MSDSSSSLLEADRVAFSYGAGEVLSSVSLRVEAGTVTTILGPSGTGKSTLLGVLGLTLKPTAGVIRVRGRDVSGLRDAELARLRREFLGPVFQAPHLIGTLSVRDNVLLPALLAGEARQKRAAAEEWLGRLGLAERMDYLPHMLSAGQKRRVSIARALLLRPAVILADEPTNDLDEARADQVADFLLDLTREGFALVLVTHDAALAARAHHRWRLSGELSGGQRLIPV